MSQRNLSSAPDSFAQPQSPPELKAGEYAALVGIDWGDRAHSVAIALPGKETEEVSTFEHSAESLHQWLDSLEVRFQGQRVAFAVEAGSKPVTRALLERALGSHLPHPPRQQLAHAHGFYSQWRQGRRTRRTHAAFHSAAASHKTAGACSRRSAD